MTNELLQKAKECKSAEELLALAKENGIEMTAEEATENFKVLNLEGELSDDELDSASGGACHTTVDGEEYTVTTAPNKCWNGCYEKGYDEDWYVTGGSRYTTRKLKRKDHPKSRSSWLTMACDGDCGSCLHLGFKNNGTLGYCEKSGK